LGLYRGGWIEPNFFKFQSGTKKEDPQANRNHAAFQTFEGGVGLTKNRGQEKGNTRCEVSVLGNLKEEKRGKVKKRLKILYEAGGVNRGEVLGPVDGDR